MNDKIQKYQIALSNLDFINKFESACIAAGGGSWDSLKDQKFDDVMNILARNGLRITFSKSWQMDTYKKEAAEMAMVDDLIKKYEL